MVLSKKPPLLLTVGAALLFIGGGAIAFWVASRRGGIPKHLPVGADVIPQNAIAVFSLSTDEAEWRRLRQFGTEATQSRFDQFLASWYQRAFTDNQLQFQSDLQPWIGPEVSIVLLPETDTSDAATGGLNLPSPDDVASANLVLVVPIADAAKAQTQLGNQLNEAPDLADNPYRGVSIQTMGAAADHPLYGAVLTSQLAVISGQPSLIKRMIDVYRGGSSLANRPGVSKAFDHLDATNSMGRFYVDVPALVETLSQRADPPLPASNLEKLKVPRGLSGVVTVENQGIHVQSVSWLEAGVEPFATGNQASQMPQLLPGNTLLMASTGNFQQFWQDFQAGRQWSALIPFQADNLILGLQSATGLNLEDDLLPWLGGELALGILQPAQPKPAKQDTPAPEAVPSPALVVMAKVSDRTAAEAAFDQLNDVMATRYRYSVDSQDLGGVPVTRWVSPFGSLTMTHGWLEGDIAFFTLGTGVAEMIAPAPSRPLATTSRFQITTGAAPRPNNGHFFIDLDAIAKAQNNLLLPPLPDDGLIGSGAIDAIGVTATVLGERQVQYDLFAALKRGPRPGPLPLPATPPSPSPPPASPSPSPPDE